MSQTTIAIVAWQALPAIDPRQGEAVGGMEISAWTFARGLAKDGRFAVTFVVRSPRKLKTSSIDGVKIEASVEPFEAMRRRVSAAIEFTPRLRMKSWRARLLWELPMLAITRPFRLRDPLPRQPDPRLMHLSSTVWIGMGVNRASAGVIATAEQQQRPVVIMVRSNTDLDPRIAEDDAFVNEYGESAEVCRYVLQRSNMVICQSEHQLRLLERYFGRKGVLVRNPIDLELWRTAAAEAARIRGRDPFAGVPDKRPYVAWVGRYDDFIKRADLAMAIAQQCPDIPFRMVINPFSETVEATLRKICPSNVELINYIAHDKMPAFFGNSRVFLSTSSAAYEGFPNVLLQAAAAGKPIVSLDDFDGFLKRSNAGFVCDGSISQAVSHLRAFWNGEENVDPVRVQDYLERHHAQQPVIDALAELIERVAWDGT